MVAVAKPVVRVATRAVVYTLLYTDPSLVQYEVVVYGCVSSASSADVMVVASDSVERLIVLEPNTTRLLRLPVSVRTTPLDVARVDTAANVDVRMLEVTVEPAALVVVTAMVVGMFEEIVASADEDSAAADEDSAAADADDAAAAEDSALDAAEDDASVDCGAADVLASVEDGASVLVGAAVLVGSVVGAAVVPSVVPSVVGAAELVVGIVVGSTIVVADVALVTTMEVAVVVGSTIVVAEVVGTTVVLSIDVEVVMPVPATCRLLGMTPAGMSCALICEKPNMKENIIAKMLLKC